ncbi:MAG: DUF6672 family protein [Fusobacteriaceae bacterium]
MKRVISILCVFIFFIGLSVFLYKTGKGHNVYVTNYEIEGVTPIKEIQITMDGNKKIIKVKNGKKNFAVVKGSNHNFVLTYKASGEKKELKGRFDTIIGKEAVLDLSKFANGGKDWVSYEKIEVEEETVEPEEPAVSSEVKIEI